MKIQTYEVNSDEMKKNYSTQDNRNLKMIHENLSSQIEFIKEIDKVKYNQRRTKLFNSARNENDAEHS